MLEVSTYGPACFVESGNRLTPDFAGLLLGRLIDFVGKVKNVPESPSLEEVSGAVNDLKVRVTALDCNQTLQRVVLDDLAVRVHHTSARSLEDHDETVNRRNEHKIVIHGLKGITVSGRVEVKAAALREVTGLFQELFGSSNDYTIVQVYTFVIAFG